MQGSPRKRALTRMRAVTVATGRNLAAPDRSARFRSLLNHWVEMDSASARKMRAATTTRVIRERYLAELWPDMAGGRASTTMDVRHGWELPYGERAVVDAIVRYVRPSVAFEFGTFSGSTTMLIADAAPPGATVHTIDVPEEVIDESYLRLGVTPGMIGARLREHASLGATIQSHRQLIEDFDFEPFQGTVDFILIDASHEYDDVRDDSRRALSLVGRDGVIVWDDYIGSHHGVTAALDDLSAQVALAHIGQTRLVVHGRGRFAFDA